MGHLHGKFISAVRSEFLLRVFACPLYEQAANKKVSSQNRMGLKFSSRSFDITAPLSSVFLCLFFTFLLRKNRKKLEKMKLQFRVWFSVLDNTKLSKLINNIEKKNKQ